MPGRGEKVENEAANRAEYGKYPSLYHKFMAVTTVAKLKT